ncbi:translation initiation factor eIF-2B subunit epsilon [Lobosporangium transversale]|uniref:Translation initiation factor eIF2B subunit epsilon n=1 Tax=Lobosporangium transversale TaxID=64571 RepID=A0A1Y2GWF8_9FUNG|nr:translation initiation factor eIF-2B subunit epsilon [Lobosporangium transversale]ORZ23764.1 translation initiation factor eIF-2B subunit epsilon [Lobosporangium transversale]|eukprot:XP_021883578.1 translation initiation factor eIF-2B subunit epsilon [Lobosporangium transversale]
MPPKEKVESTEQLLQAVILADSFDERFQPITLETARCLLPLCNVPLISYTFEFLAVAGVQEIYVFCCSHSEKVKDYVKQYEKTSNMKIHTIVSQECYSVGDAMRELDAKQLIDTDFILVSGDVVSNMKLDKVLEEHRARRQADKSAIMTMVLKKASPHHRSRAVGDGSLFVLDQSSKECLHYQPVKAFKSTRQDRRMTMDMEIFEKHPEIQIRNDLIDCQIDICSVEVPALFTENFDYQDIRADFVHGILTSDLLGKTIHFHEVSDVYAARVRSTQMYDAVSKDIISRWTFPMVPDSNLPTGDCYEYRRGLVYKEKSVVLSRTCVVEEKVVIGANTQIAENSVLSNCVIGKNCVIGANVKIDNAYIWDNVTVKDNCVVQRSIIANGAVLEQGVTVSKGCLISFNVIIGANTTVPPYSRITALPDEEEGEDELVSEPAVVGATGHGRSFKEAEDSDDEEDQVDPRNKQVNRLAFDMSALNFETLQQEESASEFESEASDVEEDEVNPAEELDREITQTLERAFKEDHDVDIAALELNTLRMASNSNFHEMRKRIIPGVLKNIDLSAKAGSKKTVKAVLTQWGPLIGKMIHDEEDQVDGLFILQKACATIYEDPALAQKIFAPTLRYFYDEEIAEEDSILKWYHSEASRDGTETEKRLHKVATPMIEFLEQSESEEDDEDEDSE